MTTPQQPIHSGFEASSTAQEVGEGISLKGKTVIITGGYSGIGVETARVLANAGAEVIVPARDLEKAQKTLAGIPNVKIEKMDLMNPSSIDAFAERFLALKKPLHILVNSAGIMACPLARDAQGNESQFATNHLGHFRLVIRLWSALREAKGSRVVSLSSYGHRFSPVVFEDLNFEKREYDRWAAYGQSKTANVLFALELDKRGKADGIRAFSVHPGAIVGTGLDKHVTREEYLERGVMDEQGNRILDPKRQLKNVEQGAATSVWCATSPKLEGLGGVYCENSDIAELNAGDTDRPFGVRPYAVDPQLAERLWSVSEQLVFGGKTS